MLHGPGCATIPEPPFLLQNNGQQLLLWTYTPKCNIKYNQCTTLTLVCALPAVLPAEREA